MPHPQRPASARPGSGGPSAAVYRRRRLAAAIVVLVVVLAVLGGVWALVANLTSSSHDDADATGGTSATGEAPTSGAETGTGTGTGEATPSPSPTTEPSVGATPPLPVSCAPAGAALSVTAPATAAAGSAVTATVGVTVTGTDPCLVDLGSDALVVEVWSGDVRLWTSEQCPFEPTSRALLLPAGASDEQSVTWPGSQSVEGCAAPGPVAEPGTYRVVATQTRDGQVLTGEATFVLQ